MQERLLQGFELNQDIVREDLCSHLFLLGNFEESLTDDSECLSDKLKISSRLIFIDLIKDSLDLRRLEDHGIDIILAEVFNVCGDFIVQVLQVSENNPGKDGISEVPRIFLDPTFKEGRENPHDIRFLWCNKD